MYLLHGFFNISDTRPYFELLLYTFDKSRLLEVQIFYYTDQLTSLVYYRLKHLFRDLFLNKCYCSGIFIWNINIQKPSCILNLLIASFPYRKSVILTYSSRILKRYNQA